MEPNTEEGFGFRISTVQFNDFTEVKLLGDDVVVFVGPNNAGKTESLWEIVRRLQGKHTPIVKNVSFIRGGTPDQTRKWLNAHFTKSDQDYWASEFGLSQVALQDYQLEKILAKNELGNLAFFVCGMVGTEERLAATKPTRSPDVHDRRTDHPLQRLFFKPELESTISKACHELFGFNVILDRWAGEKLRLLCGEQPNEKAWSEAHRKALDALPCLEDQGDGVRSLVGSLMETCGAAHLVTLVDEPEAFLQPSLARQLGKMLVRNRRTGTQLFIATHSADLLCGVLDGGTGRVRIVRICRDGASNRVRELCSDDIERFWSDSMIRSSNALDGLFHDKVVLCEGDSDCRFYSCMLEAVLETNGNLRRPDIMFLPTGGKHRVPVLAKALKAIDVSVRVVADFDLLSDEKNLRAVVESVGEDWSGVEPDWRVVFSALNNLGPLMPMSQVRAEIQSILNEEKGKYLSEGAAEKIRKKVRAVSAWSSVKRTGKTSVPSGDAMVRYEALSAKLRRAGVFLVEVGELERFAPSVGADGPAWVNAVLQKKLASDPELAGGRAFVSIVAGID